jgi:hypothetical protein
MPQWFTYKPRMLVLIRLWSRQYRSAANSRYCQKLWDWKMNWRYTHSALFSTVPVRKLIGISAALLLSLRTTDCWTWTVTEMPDWFASQCCTLYIYGQEAVSPSSQLSHRGEAERHSKVHCFALPSMQKEGMMIMICSCWLRLCEQEHLFYSICRGTR